MKQLRQSLVVILMPAIILSACSTIALTGKSKIGPEAEPVYNWLKAVKTADAALLQAAFSQKMLTIFEQSGKGWPELLTIYTGVFTDKFGNYELSDFALTFEGGTTRGNVLISKGDGSSPLSVYVVKEDNGWKVNER